MHKTLRATTLNISDGGICIKLTSFGSVDLNTIVAVQMQDFPLINGKVVWTNARIIGIVFIDEIDQHPELAQLLDRLKG